MSLRLGAIAAALTHFSAFFWSVQSSVVMTVYPPVSTASHVSARSSPQRIEPSWWRTCQTKWGASQLALTGGLRTTGSLRAASKSAAENVLFVSGSGRSACIRVRMRSRRATICESSGTTSCVLPAGQSAPSAILTEHCSSAFLMRS